MGCRRRRWLPDELCRGDLRRRVRSADVVDAEGQGESPFVGVVVDLDSGRRGHRHRSGRRRALSRPPRPPPSDGGAWPGSRGGGPGRHGGRRRTISTDWVGGR